MGTGRCKDAGGEAAFRVVLWPAAARWREILELPPKDFHITLGFQDAEPWEDWTLIGDKTRTFWLMFFVFLKTFG